MTSDQFPPELVEKVAKAAWDAARKDVPPDAAGEWEKEDDETRATVRAVAIASLSATFAWLREPPEEMWGGLARDLMMWMDISHPPTGRYLHHHLSAIGVKVPDWLREEIPDADHVPSKGTRVVCIFRAMLDVINPQKENPS